MGKRVKVYLDTSVISYLLQEERGVKHSKTLELWKLLKSKSIDVYISEFVIFELEGCEGNVKKALFELLEKIDYQVLSLNQVAVEIRSRLLEDKILTEKDLADCSHISIATANNVDYILSWNFRHFVKDKTKKGLGNICKESNLKMVNIVSPDNFLNLVGEGKNNA